MPIKKTIGENIRKHRHLRGWTQKQLGEAVDLVKETISRLESGKHNVTVDKLQEIADVLGISMEEICLENAQLISFRFLLSEHNIETLDHMVSLIKDIIHKKNS